MQNVFITGASSGIGAELARQYAQQGAVLGLVARRKEVLEQLRQSLPNSEKHFIYPLDVTDHAALAGAARAFTQATGGAHIVIANAGVSMGTLSEFTEDIPIFEQVIATNLLATVATFAPFISDMKSRAAMQSCRLVGIGSVAGIRGLPGAEAYIYEGADHAFARKDGVRYLPEPAALDDSRTVAFLERNLLG